MGSFCNHSSCSKEFPCALFVSSILTNLSSAELSMIPYKKILQNKGNGCKKIPLNLKLLHATGPRSPMHQAICIHVCTAGQLFNSSFSSHPFFLRFYTQAEIFNCITFYLIFSHCRKIRGRKRFPAVYGLTLTHAASHFSLVENTSISHKGNVGDR